jgi:hypothetical protein
MIALTNEDEMFFDILREQIAEAIDESKFEMEMESHCSCGQCPREYRYLDDSDGRNFADVVIAKLVTALESKK